MKMRPMKPTESRMAAIGLLLLVLVTLFCSCFILPLAHRY